MKLLILQGAARATFNETTSKELFGFKEISCEEGIVHLTYASKTQREAAKPVLLNSPLTCGEMKHDNGYVLFVDQADLIITIE